ncbi:hypothetical protein SZ39_0873 [Bacillus mycoides]|nr:hypothetical protein SZ39_0873 [Bacillus mycoides]KZD32741.1 hypothetical protein B4083_4414 [Bacillus cereus]
MKTRSKALSYLSGLLPAGFGTIPLYGCCQGFIGPVPPPFLDKTMQLPLIL